MITSINGLAQNGEVPLGLYKRQKEETENHCPWLCFPVSHTRSTLGTGGQRVKTQPSPRVGSVFQSSGSLAAPLPLVPGFIFSSAQEARLAPGEHPV